MSRSVQELLTDALELPQTQREALAASIYDSLELQGGEAPDSWITEAQRRAGEIDSGAVLTGSWDEAISRLKQRFGA